MRKALLTIASILSVGSAFALPNYSYCSKGVCRTITNAYFHQVRGMPLDLSFSCVEDDHYALTFDDGPSANFPQLLDLLAQHEVKATFFVVGSSLKTEEQKALLKRAYREGHFMANHTLNHPNLEDPKLLESELARQVVGNRKLLRDILDPAREDERLSLSTRIVRPPFGNINERVDKVFKREGLIAVRWNGDRYDWATKEGEEKLILKRIVQQLDYIRKERAEGRLDNSSIMDLNHDFATSTLKALETAIPAIKKAGYRFVTMDECLGLK